MVKAWANDKHPNGLANNSDQAGRNFMYHQADEPLGTSTERNEDAYTKPGARMILPKEH